MDFSIGTGDIRTVISCLDDGKSARLQDKGIGEHVAQAIGQVCGKALLHVCAQGVLLLLKSHGEERFALTEIHLCSAVFGKNSAVVQIGIKSKAIGSIISTGITTAITTGLTIDDPITAGLTASATSAVSLMPTFI